MLLLGYGQAFRTDPAVFLHGSICGVIVPYSEQHSNALGELIRFGPAALEGVGALGPFGVGGSGSTVNAAEYDPGDPYAVRVASTYRFAVDTATLDRALCSLAPGQSEHPRHPHFSDGVAGWLAGRFGLLSTSRLEVEEATVSRLHLEPAP